MAGKADLLKVDVDAQPQLAARFHAQSIPYLVILVNGKTVHQQAGWPGRAS
jgi:thioredoxin-like negative regulator of GroEL